MQNETDKFFKLMAFQYKPLEKELYKICKEKNHPEIIEKYKKACSNVKIQMLDRIAQSMGL